MTSGADSSISAGKAVIKTRLASHSKIILVVCIRANIVARTGRHNEIRSRLDAPILLENNINEVEVKEGIV
jgi:hypothetical protein